MNLAFQYRMASIELRLDKFLLLVSPAFGCYCMRVTEDVRYFTSNPTGDPIMLFVYLDLVSS